MFILVEAPNLPPGSCWFCRSANRGSFVDTQRSDDFLGQCYVCEDCVRDLASIYGYLDPATSTSIQASLNNANERLIEAQTRQAHLEAIVDSFTALRGGDLTGIDSVFGSDLSSSGITKEPEPSVPELGSEVANGEGETSEPVHDEGVVKLRSDESEFSLDFNI